MQVVIERVMTTYRMMVPLTPEQEREARERVERYLQDRGSDEHMLTVEGLKYLRGRTTTRRRRNRSVQICVESGK
jgi:hypothetical protein